jgi:two-component system, OmpR family, sensor kinase
LILTLRWRLTLLYTALIALLLTGVFVAVYSQISSNIRQTLETDLNSNLDQVRRLIEASDVRYPTAEGWSSISQETFAEILQFVSEPNDIDVLSFTSRQPTRFKNVTLEQLDADVELSDEDYSALLRNKEFSGRGFLSNEGQKAVEVRALIEPDVLFVNGESTKITNVILVARDPSTNDELLATLQRTLLIVTFAGAGLAAIGSYSLAGSALEPIRAVRDAASSVSISNLSRRVPEPGTNDEVQDLARTLNGMLESLEHSFETQRRFTADASHELRTPVTAIGGHASYLLRRTNPTDQQRESLEAITTLSVRLGKLIGDLLDLARADAGFPLEPVETSLVGLAEDVHLEIVAIAGDSEIEIEGDREIKAFVDPNRIRQVIRNLVQNALKAGSSHILVAVIKEPLEKRIRLRIKDNGPGIAQEHLERLFDRFYRVDTARDRQMGGSGLGLSIVKWIVEAHKGQVVISSEVGVGTTIDVLLPWRTNQTEIRLSEKPDKAKLQERS